jgi:hypothetical protein
MAAYPAFEQRKPFMRTVFTALLLGLLLASPHAMASTSIRQQAIQFKPGAASTTLKGTLKGDQTIDYQLSARAGQALTVRFAPSNLSAYFNVLPPGSVTALFIGSTAGNDFTGTLPVDGTYTIRVYLMRNAARRNETATYTLDVSLAGAASTVFDKTLELQGIRFHVTSENQSPVRTLKIVPSGLEIDNAPIVKTIDGNISSAEVADLNADGSPEVYVYVTSAGSGSYGSLVAYAANRRKSLSEIFLPPLTEAAAQGYMGHDEFAVLEGVLGRRFPIYRDSDSNAQPTGGMRQLQYKLVPGEASWQLRLDRTSEF